MALNFQEPIINFEGWEQVLSYWEDGSIEAIPDLITIAELIYFPSPKAVLPLLMQYKTSRPRLEKVIEILNGNSGSPGWEAWDLIRAALDGTNSQRLYAIVSQAAYRNRSPQEYDKHSHQCLQIYSNSVVSYIRHRRNSPPERDLRIRDFCLQHGYDFPKWQFHHAYSFYCEALFPHPFRGRSNFEKTGQALVDLKALKIEQKQQAIIESGERYEQAQCRRFSRLSASLEALREFEVNENYMRAFTKGAFESHSITRKLSIDVRRLAAQGIPSEPRRALFQCPFCYRFDLLLLPAKGHEFPQHCDRGDCKRAYGGWKKHLHRRGISPTRETLL